MSQHKQDSDISDGGSLLALLNLGLNFNKAKAEEEENKQDQKSKKNKTIYVPEKRLMISVDQGIHGANNEGLKKWSKAHERTESNNTKHGCNNIGSKAYAAHVTNLFKDENCGKKISLNPKIREILDKPSSEITPIEMLQSSVTIVSRTNKYNPLTEVPINQINLNFIDPIYNNAKYYNDPKPATPLGKALWDKFSFDKDKPGTVTATPVSEKRHIEIMDSITTPDISKNHHVFLSTTYPEVLEAGTEIEFGLSDMEIKLENGIINIEVKPKNIPGFNYSTIQAVPFDLLHFNNPDIHDKMEATISVYNKQKKEEFERKLLEKNINEEESEKANEVYKNQPDYLTIIELDGNFRKYDGKNNKNEYKTKQIPKNDLENEIKNYNLSCKIEEKGAYNKEGWVSLDKQKLKDLFNDAEFVDKLTNYDHLNGHNLNRNNKNTTRVPPPTKKQKGGDFNLNSIYPNTRFHTNYDSELDKEVPPLLQKSETKYDDWKEHIRGPIDWVQNNFRQKLKSKYRIDTKSPKPNITSPKSNINLIIEDDSDDDDDDYFDDESEKSDEESEQFEKSEESDEESEQDDTDNNSSIKIGGGISGQSSSTTQEIPIERIEPESIPRRGSVAEYANKDKIIRALDNLVASVKYHEALDDALENLYKVHGLIGTTVFKSIYSSLTIENKVKYFKLHLNTVYLFDDDDVDEGSKFLRAYNACINEAN